MSSQMIAFLAILGPLATAADQPSLPDLETVRACYIESVTSMHTLEYKMRREYQFTPEQRAALTDDRYVGFETQRVRCGGRIADLSVALNPARTAVSRTWYGFDGALYAHWWESLKPPVDGSPAPAGEVRTERDNLVYGQIAIERLLGMDLCSGSLSLESLFQRDGVEILGWDDVDGERCVQVRFPLTAQNRLAPGLISQLTTAWLDPQYGFLPRQIREEAKYNGGNTASTYRVTLFGKIPVSDGKKFVVSMAGEWVIPNFVRETLEVDSIFINRHVADDLFVPKFPANCSVSKDIAKPRAQEAGVGDDQPASVQLQHQPRWRAYPAAMTLPVGETAAYPMRREIVVLADDAMPPSFTVEALPVGITATWESSNDSRLKRLAITFAQPPGERAVIRL